MPLKFAKVVFIATGIGLVATQAYAKCNFDQPTGTCTATLRILSSGGSKPSYSTEVEIASSAGACSKVEYYVQSTPYTAIIRSDRVEHESLSSTSPIKRRDMKVAKCTAYQDGNQAPEGQGASASNSMSGRWSYSTSADGSSVSSEINLLQNEGNISGSGFDTMTHSYDGGSVTSRWKLKITGKLKGGSGSLTIVSKAVDPGDTNHTNRWSFELEGGALKLSNGAIYRKN